jgi:hypothetical protein
MGYIFAERILLKKKKKKNMYCCKELHSQAKWLAYQNHNNNNLQPSQLYNMKNQFKGIVFIMGQSRSWQKLCFNCYKCNEVCAEKLWMPVMSEVTYGSLHLLASYFRVFQCHLRAPCRLAPWEAAQMAHPLIWLCQGGEKYQHTNCSKSHDPKFKII